MHAESFAALTLSLRLLFFSPQTSYIFMRVLCVDPSVRPSRLSIHTSVSPSIRARNTRAWSGARACEHVASACAHCSGSCAQSTCVFNVYVYAYTYGASQRRSRRCRCSGHAAHDIRRWGPCGHLISGDTRARASLLIVGSDR